MSITTTNIHELQELEKQIEWFEFSRTPITDIQILEIENTHNIKINAEIKEILTTVGCTYWTFNDMDWDWIVKSNIVCREFYQDSERALILKNGFIFSDDGAGNPVLITEDGVLYVLHHDDITYQKLDDTIVSLMEELIKRLKKKLLTQ